MCAYIKLKLENNKTGYLCNIFNEDCILYTEYPEFCLLIKNKSELNEYINILSNILLNKPIILQEFKIKRKGLRI